MEQNVRDIYELSPMQHGLLFDSVTAGDSGMYLIQLEYILAGSLSVPALERAWQRAIERHPILRTSFHWEGMPKPLQVVHAEVPISLAVEDWSDADPEECERRAAAFREEDRRRGVDFETPPLMRLALFREGGDSFRLIWTFHHILMEGWSAAVVLEDVLAFYRADLAGAAEDSVQLPDPSPYRDFITWSQEQDPSRAEEYWRAELQGFLSPTHLGIDQGTPGMQLPVTEYDKCAIQLSGESTRALQSLAATHGLTLNTVFQGAWALLVARYSGEQDAVFGTVVSGRSVPLPGVESMVGLFVNILPSRVAISPSEPLVPWLQDLQRRQLRQRDFETSPLVRVKGWSDLPAGMPLFETLLVFENWLGDLTTSDWGPDLEARDVRGHHIEAGHPLTIVVAPGPELTIDVTYDRHRFEAAAIERLLANLQVLLDGMVAAPTTCLAELPLLTDAERNLVLREWNDTRESYPEGQCIHEMFEQQVARVPTATALVCGEERLSYAELDRRANQLAHHLRGLGVRHETLVGVCVARSTDLVISLLAILKAGGAYVPLDPDYPAERLTYMLQDSGARIVVTQEQFAERLRGAADGPTVLCLDQSREQVLAESEAKPESQVGASGLAYVIYTSGSTGAPKGTAIEHRNLANLLHWARGKYDDDELSGVMLSTSICFDLSTFELFVPLCWGGRVFLAQNALELPTLAGRDEVRLVNSVPSAITALVQMEGIPASVTTVNMAGEMLRTDLVDRLYALGVKRVCDLYAPSETTTYSTFTRRTAGGPETVGTPLGNTTIYLLDRHQQPVPAGVSGEIFIGGAGVVRGYLHRPELTAERFLPDPFSGQPDARMYRTGDLARHRSDGSLELMGRLDHQVKIRGFRIEVGEIEVTLGRHPAISDQAVMAREDAPGDKRLVAYVVSQDEGRPGIEELRSHLRTRLPEFMLPAVFVWMEALPRTPNGKLDRGRLPAPERIRPELEQDFVAPRTPVEKKIAEIWLSVLEVDRVGVHDNFFDLGGHSLLLLPVTDELQKEFGLRLIAGELVHPTLGQLAALCEERMAKPEQQAPAGLMRRIYDAVRGSASRQDGDRQDRAPDRD